jgi:hypothetical protein
MRTIYKKILTATTLAMLGTSQALTAATPPPVILALKIGGEVKRSAEWQNELGQNINEAWFNFDTYTGPAARDIDSSIAQIGLANPVAGSFPVTIGLIKPLSCTIGGSAIDDTHVQFLQDGEVISGSDFSLQSGTHSFMLRFSADGNYGENSGNVRCSDGTMTYNY